LARLTPIDADAKKEGKAGCRYICHEGDKVNAFWEQENRLFTAPVTVLENEEPQLFILEKGISDFFSSQDSRSILSTDSSTTTSSQRYFFFLFSFFFLFLKKKFFFSSFHLF